MTQQDNLSEFFTGYIATSTHYQLGMEHIHSPVCTCVYSLVCLEDVQELLLTMLLSVASPKHSHNAQLKISLHAAKQPKLACPAWYVSIDKKDLSSCLLESTANR